MSPERVVDVVVPVAPDTGGSGMGVVGAMFVLFVACVGVALLVLVGVLVLFPAPDYSTVPATREVGPCEPFCSLRTTAPVGGVQR